MCFEDVKEKKILPLTEFESDFFRLTDVEVNYYTVSSRKLEVVCRSEFSVQVANHTAHTYVLLSNYSVSNSNIRQLVSQDHD